MRKCLLLSVIIAFASGGVAQSVTPEVISTSGTTFTAGGSQLDWTVGEPVIISGSSASNIVTQGFHQTNLVITAITNPETIYSVNIFPNPSIDFIELQFRNIQIPVAIELYSSDGKLVFSLSNHKTENLKLDLSKYPAGTYLLNINDTFSKPRTYQLIKSR